MKIRDKLGECHEELGALQDALLAALNAGKVNTNEMHSLSSRTALVARKLSQVAMHRTVKP